MMAETDPVMTADYDRRVEVDVLRVELEAARIAHRLAAEDRDGARRLCAAHERALADVRAQRDALLAELDVSTPEAALARIRAERAERERLVAATEALEWVQRSLSEARDAIEAAQLARAKAQRGGS